MAKEAASTVSGAYEAYRREHTVSVTTKPEDLTLYINYIKINTRSLWVDDVPGNPPLRCPPSLRCLELHNGGILAWDSGMNFGGSAATNALGFYFDPDGGTNNGSNAGAYHSVGFMLYLDGRLATQGTATPNTGNNKWNLGATAPWRDPSWFSWN